MKTHFTFFAALFFCLAINAQGTLQFNQVIIFTSTTTPTSPPSGKVWKVTSVMGGEARVGRCVNVTSTTDELNGAMCGVNWGTGTYKYPLVPYYFIRSISLNGNNVNLSISGLGSITTVYSNSTCTSSGTYSASTSFACADLSTDPTILPLWIPSGTTFGTGGPDTYASIIEFNIIP